MQRKKQNSADKIARQMALYDDNRIGQKQSYIDKYVNRSGLPAADRPDLAQDTHIKLMLISDSENVRNWDAYIGRTVNRLRADYYRKHRHDSNLVSLDADNEDSGNVARTLQTPSNSVEERLISRETLAWMVKQTMRFPRAQKKAMLCHFKDVMTNDVGDLPYLAQLLTQYGININTIAWPTEEKACKSAYMAFRSARQRLKDLYIQQQELD